MAAAVALDVVHMLRNCVTLWPRFMSKIRMVKGFIVVNPESLEPSIETENGGASYFLPGLSLEWVL